MPRRQLGCCEYTNRKGETAHVLGCCCDCDVLDTACDRCLRCQSQKSESSNQMANVLTDRLRIPWFGGTGAIQLQLDVFAPILIIPTLLVISITHYYVAWTVSVMTPLCLISYYRCWRSNPHRTRTRFFFSWGLVSTFTMGYVFIGATFYREIYLAEGMIILGLFLIMLYTLYLTKQDPGSIRQDAANDSFMRTYTVPKGKLSSRSSYAPSHLAVNISRLVNERLDGFGGTPRRLDWSGNVASDPVNSLPLESIDGLASQQPSSSIAAQSNHNPHPKDPPNSKSAPNECGKCCVKLPPRASHCSVCQQCYSVRDHHCIWLDQCIGLRNHRAFIVTVILFLAVATYGVHLTLTTICTPIMVLDFFLLPANCRFVYADLLGAISYVSCCYTSVAIALVSVLFIQQMILISQNITIQEFNKSIQDRTAGGLPAGSWWKSFYIADNPYKMNLRKNWMTFFRRTRHEPPSHNRSEEDAIE